jgi:FixJ family two-component response regulator
MAKSRPLIAVVDDDPSIVKSLARALRLDGYEVATFGSGQDFIVSLSASVPRCLVLDVRMPKMNGFELKDRLAAKGINVPVIFMTAHDTPHTRARATQTGSSGFFLKPFDPRALSKAIGDAVSCQKHAKVADGSQARPDASGKMSG